MCSCRLALVRRVLVVHVRIAAGAARGAVLGRDEGVEFRESRVAFLGVGRRDVRGAHTVAAAYARVIFVVRIVTFAALTPAVRA